MWAATGVADMRTSMESLEIHASRHGRGGGIAARVPVSRTGHRGLSTFALFEGDWPRV
jgi:hypothetical protein